MSGHISGPRSELGYGVGPSPKRGLSHGGNALKVLAVDGDFLTTYLIRRNLASEMMQVIEVGRGGDCMNIALADRVDLILLDPNLPDMDGWEVLSCLRATEATRHVPVVIVSGEVPTTSLMRRFEVKGFVKKPFDVRHLVEEVKRVVAAREILS